ncbi:kinase-like domain-containing protein [Rhizoctonia solani]|nr:kinase-like domain-containing protein [Rhizoctonia solani]
MGDSLRPPEINSESDSAVTKVEFPHECESVDDVLVNGVSSLKIPSTISAETPEDCTLNTRASRPQDRIMGNMEPSEIAEILRQHQVKDVTEELDLATLQNTRPSTGGGWGNVFRVRMRDGTLVAVKQTRLFTDPEHTVSIRIVKDSARELHIWSKCDHPNVMNLIGFADVKGLLAMVSPWMEGGDVSAYIREHPNVDRMKLCQQVASGLCYFHEKHMVHGDLKAQNALISLNGQVKLTDLGSSTIKDRSITFSATQTELRSLNWAPPELIAAEGEARPNPMSDIYSLGMTILEIITGEVPFSGWSSKALLARLVIAGSAQPGDIAGPRPKRPICCIPHTEKGDHIWNLLDGCWHEVSEKRPKATTVRDRLYIAYLDLNEMQVGKHLGDPSNPVCRSAVQAGA